MSTEELLKDKVVNKFKKEQERVICESIVSITNDRSYNKYFHSREMLRDRICSSSRWEVTAYGFANRSDFRYDEEHKEITYTNNQIMKKGDGYITNGTKIANDHARKCREDLKALLKLEALIDRLYLEHKDEIDTKLAEHDKFKGIFVRPLNGPVDDEKKRLDDFIKSYGNVGLELLIKWLNRLNEPSINIKTLVREYINDVNVAKEYFVTTNNEAYRNSITYNRPFEGLVLSIISTYHPRGRAFNDAFNDEKIQRNTIRR